MKFLRITVFLLMCIHNLDLITGTPETEVTYEELKELNYTCPAEENCVKGMISERCSCKASCAQLGTCCLDSPSRLIPAPKVGPTCRSISIKTDYLSRYTGYLVVDQCPQRSGLKSIYEDLCREEWSGQNDIMRIVPVASLFTHITYKNYFCFRCHELNDDYIFWKIKLNFFGEHNLKHEDFKIQLEYDKFNETWVAQCGLDGIYHTVDFDIVAPESIDSITKPCSPSYRRLISNCSEDWLDDAVRSKCEAYTYITNIARDELTLEYRNPHCALCNFESLNDVHCVPSSTGSVDDGDDKKPFSFTFLLDINRSDGDKVGQTQRCSGNDVWDPFFNKCRTLKCALPGYTVKEGKCFPP